MILIILLYFVVIIDGKDVKTPLDYCTQVSYRPVLEKTLTEPIKIQFGMMSQVGPGNHILV